MDGIYTMANDTMAEFLRTFLISARKAMPDMPISIIPFDNSLSEVSKLASLYNAEILNPSLEWDSIGQKIYEKEEYRKGISSYRYFRKFNCFSGPYSHFCYLDANCIVLDFLNEIWNLCMTDEYDILFTSRSALSRSLSSYALREVLNIISPNLEGGYNCGFFMSKKGVIDIDNAQFLGNTPNIRKLFGIAPEQAFLALYMSIKGLKHNLLFNINDTIQHGHRGDFRVSKGLDGKYHYEQGPGIGRRVYYMKWNGQNPNVLMSGVNSELVASILETDTSLEASPQLSSSNPRHIEHEQFHLFSNLTPYPDLLKDLATKAVDTIGFFTKHPTRAIEYPWIAYQVNTRPIENILDIGAGVSVLPIYFSSRGIKVITCDYSTKIRDLESKQYWTEWGYLDYSLIDTRIISKNCPLDSIGLSEASLDAVYSVSVIEHTTKSNRISMLNSAAYLVKDGGFAFITLDLVPNSEKIWNRDRGKVVEDGIVHGRLNDFTQQALEAGWKTISIERSDNLPGAATDVALIVMQRNNRVISRDSDLTEGHTSSIEFVNKELNKYFTPQWTENIFSKIYKSGGWAKGRFGSASGSGSSLEYTKNIRKSIEELIRHFDIRSFLDAPCGDFIWMNEVNLPDELLYIGLDVCGDLIKSNQELYGSARRLFMKADITVDPLPKCDLIMCRDCLFHLPFANCFDFFRNFLSSGTPYLLLTTHLNSSNLELPDDKGFRKLNMLKPPFSFSEQLALLRDYPDGAAERYMGLWSSEAIRSCIHLG